MRRSQIILLASGIVLGGLSSCSSSPTDPDDDPNNQTIPTTCEPTNTIELAVGQFAELRGNAAALVCFQSSTVHASYVLVATSAATTGGGATSFRFEATGTTPAVLPPNPVSPEPALTPATGAEGGLSEDFRFHVRMREEAEQELAARAVQEAIRSSSPPAFAPAAAPPAVGALLTLNAQSASGQQCSNPINVVGRVMVVSNKAIVVADTANPSVGFTTEDYQSFATFFDAHISPLTEEHFGALTDIDGNERTILLFTKEVNRLTSSGSSSYIGGFFHPRDLLMSGCATSNRGELLYLMVPDPTGSINSNPRSVNFVLGITASTMVHEQQHLINAARRQHVLQLSGNARNEETWLNEGLSHLAEELLFYRMAQRAPETNLSLTNIQNTGRVLELNAFQMANFQRFKEFLISPSSSSPYHKTDDLSNRGASWSFLRYVVDRQPVGHSQFLRNLVSSSTVGISNLSGAIGGTSTFAEWLADWSVAVYADDRVTNSSDRHKLWSWNTPTLIPGASPANYPIQTYTLASGAAQTQLLAEGGSVYFRFGVDPGPVGRVKVTPIGGGQALPVTLRLTLLRTR